MARAPLTLALGGGGARGMAHIGVLQVLKENGFHIKGIAGSSMGAVVGAIYCANKLEKFEELLETISATKILRLLDPQIPTYGLLEGSKIITLLEKYLGEIKLQDFQIPFAAVAAELSSGQSVSITSGNAVKALRASFAIPGVFSPVRINEKWLIDGGVASPVPIKEARNLIPNTTIISVNVNTATVPPIEESIKTVAPNRQSKYLKIFKDKPSILTTLNESVAHMQDRIAEFQAALDPPDATISPALKGVGLFDYTRATYVIKEGRRSAQNALDAGMFADFEK